jgi:RNA polymerase-binding transcription factor DksA
MAYGIPIKEKCVLKARKRTKLVEVNGSLLYPDVAKRRADAAKVVKTKKVKKVAVKKDITKVKTKKPAKSQTESVDDSVVFKDLDEAITIIFDEVVARQGSASDMEQVKAAVSEKPAIRVQVPSKNRYTPEECAEFRGLIMTKIQGEYESMCILKESLSRPADGGAASYGNAFDEGTASAEREQLTELLAKKQMHLTALNAALVRTHNGTYGICVVTGNLIPKERLLVVLHAAKCVEAKTASDNGKLIPIHDSDGSEETSKND